MQTHAGEERAGMVKNVGVIVLTLTIGCLAFALNPHHASSI